MGWNDHIDVTDLEMEILAEEYPNYEGELYNHPRHEQICIQALHRFFENKFANIEHSIDTQNER